MLKHSSYIHIYIRIYVYAIVFLVPYEIFISNLKIIMKKIIL